MAGGKDTWGEILSCFWLFKEQERGQSEDLIFLGASVLLGSMRRIAYRISSTWQFGKAMFTGASTQGLTKQYSRELLLMSLTFTMYFSPRFQLVHLSCGTNALKCVCVRDGMIKYLFVCLWIYLCVRDKTQRVHNSCLVCFYSRQSSKKIMIKMRFRRSWELSCSPWNLCDLKNLTLRKHALLMGQMLA